MQGEKHCSGYRVQSKQSETLRDSRIPRITIQHVLVIGVVLCILIHAIYLFVFSYINVRPMFFVNIGSVTIYILLLAALAGRHTVLVMHATYLEIIVHAILATIYTGWEYGFYLFFICLAAVAFYLPFRKKWEPYVYCLIIFILYVILRIAMAKDIMLSTVQGQNQATLVLYLFNSCVCFGLLSFFSWLHGVMQKRSEYEIEQQKRQLEILASVDPLTGLYNRRKMMEQLDHMRVTCSEILIAIMDIDDFKKVNDQYGHDCGDEVLRIVSEELQKFAIEDREVSRWGGEEFLIAVPNTTLQKGTQILEELRLAIAQRSIDYQGQLISVTVTIGVSQQPLAQSFDKMIIEADNYLYKGKQSGKNRVVYN